MFQSFTQLSCTVKCNECWILLCLLGCNIQLTRVQQTCGCRHYIRGVAVTWHVIQATTVQWLAETSVFWQKPSFPMPQAFSCHGLALQMITGRPIVNKTCKNDWLIITFALAQRYCNHPINYWSNEGGGERHMRKKRAGGWGVCVMEHPSKY